MAIGSDALRDVVTALAEQRIALDARASEILRTELKPSDTPAPTHAQLRTLLRAVQDFLGPRMAIDVEGTALIETLEAMMRTHTPEAAASATAAAAAFASAAASASASAAASASTTEPIEGGAAAAAADALLDRVLSERLAKAKVGVMSRARPLDDRCQWVAVPPALVDPRDATARMEESDVASHPCDPLRARVIHFERLDLPGTWLCFDSRALMEYLESQDPRIQAGEPLPRNVSVIHPLRQPAMSAVVDLLREQHRRHIAEANERGEIVDERPKEAFPDSWGFDDIQRIRDYYLAYRAAWGVCRASSYTDITKFLESADRMVPADRADDELPRRSWSEWALQAMDSMAVGFVVYSVVRILLVVTLRSLVLAKHHKREGQVDRRLLVADFVYTLLGSFIEFVVMRAKPVLERWGLQGGLGGWSIEDFTKSILDQILDPKDAMAAMEWMNSMFGWLIHFRELKNEETAVLPQIQLLKSFIAVGGLTYGTLRATEIAGSALRMVLGDSITRHPTTFGVTITFLTSAVIVLFMPKVIDFFVSDVVEVADPIYSLLHNTLSLGVAGGRASTFDPFTFTGRIPVVGKLLFEDVLGVQTELYKNQGLISGNDLKVNMTVTDMSGMVSMLAGGDILARMIESFIELTIPGRDFRLSTASRKMLRRAALMWGLVRFVAQAVTDLRDVLADLQYLLSDGRDTTNDDRYKHLNEPGEVGFFHLLLNDKFPAETSTPDSTSKA